MQFILYYDDFPGRIDLHDKILNTNKNLNEILEEIKNVLIYNFLINLCKFYKYIIV